MNSWNGLQSFKTCMSIRVACTRHMTSITKNNKHIVRRGKKKLKLSRRPVVITNIWMLGIVPVISNTLFWFLSRPRQSSCEFWDGWRTVLHHTVWLLCRHCSPYSYANIYNLFCFCPGVWRFLTVIIYIIFYYWDAVLTKNKAI